MNGQRLCEIARSDATDVEAALDAAHAAKDAWGRTSAGRARADPEPDRRPDGGEPRAPGHAETWDNGKPIRETTAADLPLAIDHFRYFAGCDPGAGRLDLRDRPRHRRLPLPRAARRRRPDHPVELPAADGVLEARPRARRRQLRGAEAGRADARLDPALGRAGRRPAAAGRAQHRQRLRPRGRQAARLEPAHRQDRLHRRDHDRPADHAVRQPEPDPGDARARRQVPQHLLRRRRRRGRRLLRQGDRRLRDVRAQPGRGLHLPEPRADPRVDLRPVHGAGARPRRGDRAGRPARPGDHDRRAGLERAAGEDPVLHRHRPAGRRRGADRRRSAPTCRATSPAATTSSRRCSRATTRCGSSRRRSSGRWCR